VWTIARAVLIVLLIVLLAPLASADTVQVDIDLQWTVPYLPTTVRFTGSELWENGVGYVVPKISTQRWQVTGTGCPTCAYTDFLSLGFPPPPYFLLTVETFLPPPPAVRLQHFFISVNDNDYLPMLAVIPGDYDISRSIFHDESVYLGGNTPENTFFASQGYVRVSAVPELGSLLLLAVALVCLVGARRPRRV